VESGNKIERRILATVETTRLFAQQDFFSYTENRMELLLFISEKDAM
jgi:hypothetical protein